MCKLGLYSAKFLEDFRMRRFVLMIAALFALSCCGFAQASGDDAPATKEDIQQYLDVMHSHDMMKQMGNAMAQGMHQMMHDLYLKHQSELPPDYEKKMTAMMDDMMRNMPWDDMMKAMSPVYQKHFTRGDVHALVAFYSTPTGQKILRELPQMTTEAMQTATPIMSKYMETMQQRVQRETNQMIAANKANRSQPSRN